MDWDLDAAATFVATHGRVLERRRLAVLLGDVAGAAGAASALEAYRNPDGGYGWGLEPDLRSASSQPVGAMQALEVLADVADASSRPVEVCDWLAGHALADGGMPFALPFSDTGGSAAHWTGADTTSSSIQMTTQLAAQAHRLARFRPDVAAHPWLAASTEYCLSALEDASDLHPYELMFVLRFLDAATADGDERAARLLGRFVTRVVADGPTPVPGGAEGEALHLLDFTPYRGSPSRECFTAAAVAEDLARLAGRQQPDGGWTIDFTTQSPAAALEWRGCATVQAVGILRGVEL